MQNERIFSPNGKVYVEFGEDFGEIRMGSPEFGKIQVRRVEAEAKAKFRLFAQAQRKEVDVGDRLFSGVVAFSPDSRFVALEQLVEDHRLRSASVGGGCRIGQNIFCRYAFGRNGDTCPVGGL
jgi:hypothetical protein